MQYQYSTIHPNLRNRCTANAIARTPSKNIADAIIKLCCSRLRIFSSECFNKILEDRIAPKAANPKGIKRYEFARFLMTWSRGTANFAAPPPAFQKAALKVIDSKNHPN